MWTIRRFAFRGAAGRCAPWRVDIRWALWIDPVGLILQRLDHPLLVRTSRGKRVAGRIGQGESEPIPQRTTLFGCHEDGRLSVTEFKESSRCANGRGRRVDSFEHR